MMKAKVLAMAAYIAFMVSCAFFPARSRVELVVAPPSDAWFSALGRPLWSIRWFDPDGELRRQDGVLRSLVVDLELEGATPICAWPYWPGAGIPMAYARPYGAVSPYQLKDGRLLLDPPGGVAAFFFLALEAAEGSPRTAPELFDWPRFAALVVTEAASGDFRSDPWSADWIEIARKTRSSGFDSRRLVPRANGLPEDYIDFEVPVPGPWASSSPYRSAPEWTEGGTVRIGARGVDESFFCSGGMLRASGGIVAWFPLPPSGLSNRMPGLSLFEVIHERTIAPEFLHRRSPGLFLPHDNDLLPASGGTGR